ncbi:MAG: HD domain-containing protein [Chitinivibrionales bacterium]|nr:HD domain-containing protein [Chitinivibrionales bacterium]MBD3395453.1 HD domain-containing protein [Chitinivibrionales bacterium]
MISPEQGVELLEKHGISERRIRHSLGVAEIAHGLAVEIASRNPGINVNPEKVRIAALLHDIGRSRKAGDHVLNSIAILREEGLDDLAEIVMHGSAYEEALLRGIDDPSLLPDSTENKIVAYADTRFRLSGITMQERLAEAAQRRADKPDKIKAIDMARPRYQALEEELRALAGNAGMP